MVWLLLLAYRLWKESKDCIVVDWWSLFWGFDPNSPLAPGRPTNGGCTPITWCKLCSPYITVGGEGFILPGGLESMPNLTVVGIGAVAWKPSHDSGYTCNVLGMSHLNRYEIALSKKRYLIREPSEHLSLLAILHPLPLLICCFQSQSGLFDSLRSLAKQSRDISWLKYAALFMPGGQWSNPE